MSWADIKKRFFLWLYTTNLQDLENTDLYCILEDTYYSRSVMKIYGMDEWEEWASKSFTIAEDYRWKIEQLGGSIKEEL